MKRIYEPVLVSPYEMNGVVNVYVVVDNPDIKLNYTLEIQVISWEVSHHLGEGRPLAGGRSTISWEVSRHLGEGQPLAGRRSAISWGKVGR